METLIWTFIVIGWFIFIIWIVGCFLTIPYNPVVMATYDKKKEILTLTFKSGVVNQYKGDCTVWHTYPMMKRCDTNMEIFLSEIWEYIEEHGNPYPTAHKEILRET